MRDLSKDFYEKINNKFEVILHENDQTLFVVKNGESTPLDMDYSRVLFNCLFEIFKKDATTRSLSKIESEEFCVVDEDGVTPTTFHIHKDGVKADLTKEQYEKILIDSCGNIFKIDPHTNRAIPAEANSGFTAVIV
jgi:hypothetical protein